MFLLRWVGAHSKDIPSSNAKKFVNCLSYHEGDYASVSQGSGWFRPNFLRDPFVFDIHVHQTFTCTVPVGTIMNTLQHSGYGIVTRHEYFLTQSTLCLLTIPVKRYMCQRLYQSHYKSILRKNLLLK